MGILRGIFNVQQFIFFNVQKGRYIDDDIQIPFFKLCLNISLEGVLFYICIVHVNFSVNIKVIVHMCIHVHVHLQANR